MSATFKPEKYKYDASSGSFSLYSKIQLPGDVTFTLEETISSDGLDVMENVVKGGISLTPHKTPIEYRRVESV